MRKRPLERWRMKTIHNLFSMSSKFQKSLKRYLWQRCSANMLKLRSPFYLYFMNYTELSTLPVQAIVLTQALFGLYLGNEHCRAKIARPLNGHVRVALCCQRRKLPHMVSLRFASPGALEMMLVGHLRRLRNVRLKSNKSLTCVALSLDSYFFTLSSE